MKKRNLSKYIAILLFVTMLSLIAIAGTYAKYTSSFNGGGTANVADWNVTVNGETPGSTTFTLTATDMIYPGAYSVYLGDIQVTNNSSVVSAKVTSVNASISDNDELSSRITLNVNNDDDLIAPNDTATIPVYASWEYTENDETSYANGQIQFNVELTVDQVIQ